MKNIVVLVSGGGTNLQVLLDEQAAGNNPNGRIKCVISSKPDAYALERAKNSGVKTRVLNRKDYPDNSSYSKDMLELLVEEQADLIVYAGFMTILDERICRAFPNQMINVHPSLIPSFCGVGYYGLNVHKRVLERGVKLSGATVHFVDEVCDGGPIILQKAVEVLDNDTPESLQKRVMVEGEQKILPQAVRLFCDGRLSVENNRVIISE